MRRPWKWVLLASLGALLAACGGFAPPPAEVEVNGVSVVYDDTGNPTGEVYVNLSALSAEGVPVGGEIQSVRFDPDPGFDYSVTASVEEQIVVRQSVNVVIDLDSSGSMADNDPTGLRKDAAKAFVDRMGSSDRAAVMDFGAGVDTDGRSDVYFRASRLLADFTSDKETLKQAIDQVTADGSTPLWKSLLDALDLHEADQQATGNTAPRAVLLLTDGQDTDGGYDDARQRAIDLGIRVFTVGLGNQLDWSELQEIAQETGGTFAHAAQADELEALFNKLFNAVRASGRVKLTFDPPPAKGEEVTGTLVVMVNGAVYEVELAIQF